MSTTPTQWKTQTCKHTQDAANTHNTVLPESTLATSVSEGCRHHFSPTCNILVCCSVCVFVYSCVFVFFMLCKFCVCVVKQVQIIYLNVLRFVYFHVFFWSAGGFSSLGRRRHESYVHGCRCVWVCVWWSRTHLVQHKEPVPWSNGLKR